MSVELLKQADWDFLALSRAWPNGLKPFSFTRADTRLDVWDSGVLCIEPAAPLTDLDVVVSCGIHGNETAPIELCNRLLEEILAGRLAARRRLLLIFGHLQAINGGVRQLQHNLNRLFSGGHQEAALANSGEAQRARQLEGYVCRFFERGQAPDRLHYDLHTAIRASEHEKFAIYPYRHGQPYCRQPLRMLLEAGVATVLLAEAPTHTFSYYSSHRHRAHAFTVELGRVRPFGHNDPGRVAAMERQLAGLIGGRPLPPAEVDLAQMTVYRIVRQIIKQHADFALCFPDDQANFSRFAPGTLIARESGREYRIRDAERIVFPNAHVALGHRALALVTPCKLSESELV